MNVAQLGLGIALNGTGWHTASWREPTANPEKLCNISFWLEQVREAERGLVDFVTVEDPLGLQSESLISLDHRVDKVRGVLDAVLLAARLGPLTTHIGLIPTVNVTHTEPFHIATSIATLDHITSGRAGIRPQISARADHAQLFGRRETPQLTMQDISSPERIGQKLEPLFAEAADVITVARLLWDSWDDDAEIRDALSGRFIDHTKIRHINFHGPYFSVKGPAITPRPPQGQPIVATLAHAKIPYELAAKSADIVFITPKDLSHIARIQANIQQAVKKIGRDTSIWPLLIYADLLVLLDNTSVTAQTRLERLNNLAGNPLESDAAIFIGNIDKLIQQILSWHTAGVHGIRLRPATIPHDLTIITQKLIPKLQHTGIFRTTYTANTLRQLLGLKYPQSEKYHKTSGQEES